MSTCPTGDPMCLPRSASSKRRCAQAESLKAKAQERARAGGSADANVVTVDDVHDAVEIFRRSKKARY